MVEINDKVEKTKDISDEIWDNMETSLMKGKWSAGEDILKAGHIIHYWDDKYPNHTIKKYPDGRKELVDRIDGKEVVIEVIKA